MALAGTHHITIPPPLLAQLAATPAAGWVADTPHPQINPAADKKNETDDDGTSDKANLAEGIDKGNLLDEAILKDESRWRMAFTRAEGGEAERKLGQAINIFADVQEQMEGMVRRVEVAGRVAAV